MFGVTHVQCSDVHILLAMYCVSDEHASYVASIKCKFVIKDEFLEERMRHVALMLN